MKADPPARKKRPSPKAKTAEPGARPSRRSWKDYLGEIFVVAAAVAMGAVLLEKGATVIGTIGLLLCLALLLVLFYKDVERYRPEFVRQPSKLLLVGVILVLNLALARVFFLLLGGLAIGVDFLDRSTVIYGLPLATGAMLAALLVDVHVAILVATLSSLTSALWLQDASFAVYAFVGSITGAFMVIQCRKRSAVLRAGLFVSLASLASGLAVILLRETVATTAGYSTLVFALINGAAVASMVSLLLPILENAFKITTDIRLLELLDLNQPLLRNLLLQAPGTYHHSIIVGNLAEAAAEAVGANPLLARVSAYYHDIGKARMPEYFIENQQSIANRHEKLSTTMSSLIITSHVKEGVELARSQKLPEPIIEIIREHHGTTLMTYFYEKAKSHHDPSNAPLNEDDYRYPGPKPQSRVSALVMLADAVEAASRVLTDPTPARISALVEKITNRIFLDGQLDGCELTLKDLQQIKQTFVYILASIFHKRIDYPGLGIDDQNPPYPTTHPGRHEGARPSGAAGPRSLRVVKGRG